MEVSKKLNGENAILGLYEWQGDDVKKELKRCIKNAKLFQELEIIVDKFNNRYGENRLQWIFEYCGINRDTEEERVVILIVGAVITHCTATHYLDRNVTFV